VPHRTLFLNGPLAIFLDIALVVFLLALGKRDLTLDEMFFPVDLGGHTGVALLLDAGEQARQLFAMQQQLAGAVRFADDVGAGGVERRDVATDQPGFAVLEDDVAVRQLHFLLTHAFDFPAEQHHPGFERVFDEIIMKRLFVAGDSGVECF